MGAVPSKDVSLKVDSVGVINVFPDPPHNSSPPAVINNNQSCRCNHNNITTKKEITFPPPPPPPLPSSPSPPPPTPDSFRRCDDNEDKKKETESNDICAPGFFSDFGKQANDLLTKDYYNKDMSKSFFSIKTHSNAGVDLTLTALKKKKNMHTRSNGLTIGDLTARYQSKTNKNNSIQFKIDAAAPTSDEADKSNNGFLTTTQFQYEVVPDFMNVFMSMEYPDMSRGSRSKIGCQCFIPEAHLNFTAASTFNELPILEGSATIGTHDLAIGGDVVGDTKKSEFKYRGGIRHVNSMFDVSAVIADDTTMKVSCVHPLNLKNKSYGVAEFKKNFLTNEAPMTLTVGTLFEVNHPWKEEMKTVVKAKLDNHGKVGVVLQQQLIDDKALQFCSEFDTMAFNNTPRIGVSLCSIES